MKANDEIPEDEMLLAEAIAAAKARRMRWNRGCLFDYGGSGSFSEPTACCAYGALILAEKVPVAFIERPSNIRDIAIGNDEDEHWSTNPYDNNDHGESLGWAFRCAMTQDDE